MVATHVCNFQPEDRELSTRFEGFLHTLFSSGTHDKAAETRDQKRELPSMMVAIDFSQNARRESRSRNHHKSVAAPKIPDKLCNNNRHRLAWIWVGSHVHRGIKGQRRKLHASQHPQTKMKKEEEEEDEDSTDRA